jgi:antitoxin component of MazEF toxin-antitoxin module
MFNFGNRKVTGVNYTRYISLPKAWLNATGIDIHSEIRIQMNDKQELVLTPVTRQDDTGASQE